MISSSCDKDAKWLVDTAIRLLREKPVNSTLTERLFLLDDAWKTVADLPQPLQQGKGLYEVLSKASLPVMAAMSASDRNT